MMLRIPKPWASRQDANDWLNTLGMMSYPREINGRIRGVHTMFYSSQAERCARSFATKLELPGVDVGECWLLFDLPEADLACRPVDAQDGAPRARETSPSTAKTSMPPSDTCAAWSSRAMSRIAATVWSST
jgi:hypothetical protein